MAREGKSRHRTTLRVWEQLDGGNTGTSTVELEACGECDTYTVNVVREYTFDTLERAIQFAEGMENWHVVHMGMGMIELNADRVSEYYD